MEIIRKIQIMVTIYAIGQIALIVSLSIYSFYLNWWLDCLPPVKSGSECHWSNYKFGLILLDLVAIYLFWFSSKLLFLAWQNLETVLSKRFKLQISLALLSQLLIYVIPLGVLWIDDTVDRLFDLWMVWNILNIGNCTAAWYYLNIFLIKEDLVYYSTN